MKNATTNMTVEQAQSTIEFCEYAFRNMDLSDAAFDKCLAEYGAAKAVIDNAAKIAETEETVEVKAARKNYSLNPVIDENSPLKLNHLNIFINGGNLKFDGTFECKKLETAYRRFTKIMEQASRDIPELEGWGKDSWGEVKKFNRVDSEYENECGWLSDDENVFLHDQGGENRLAVDINEDYFYIWGNFPDAFEVTEQVAEVSTVEEKTEASEYKPQTSWENPHDFSTEGCLDTDRYLAARNHFTTFEELLPELGELKTEIDATNDKYLLAGIGLLICSHFDLNEARKVFGLILSEYRAEAEATEDDVKKLYNVCAQINFDKTFEHLPEFEYVRDGIKEETLDKAHDIFRAIRYNLGDQALASELTKLADEFGIDRALLLQSDDCKFNPALFDEKPTEPAPELTGKMKWAVELLDNYTYEFEGDWEAGNGGLARHYKRFNRYGEECGKLVEVFTDKTGFILDHVNIVDKSIRTYYYINGEQLSYLNGEFTFVWSDKYKAGMNVVGGEHLQVEVPDGQWKKYKNFMVNNDKFFQIMSERGACTIGEPKPPEIPTTVAPAEPELLDMEEELEDVMMDKKIAEENHKLDEAGFDTEVFSLLPALEETDEDDETDEPEILNADIWVNINHSPQQDCAFVTVGTDDLYFEGVKLVSILNDAYDFRLKFTPSGRKQFSYRGEIISAKKVADIYMNQLAAKEAAGELKLPFVNSFTVKRDRLIAERDAANAKLKRAERVFKAARLAAHDAHDEFYNFMVNTMSKLNERINLPVATIEVKTADGNCALIYTDTTHVDFDDLKFILRGDCSEINGLTLGTYDTPEQVMTAVVKFKMAIERGDKRFDFVNQSSKDSQGEDYKIAS